MNSFHFSTLVRAESTILPSLYALPFYDFDLRASHARTLLPAALASVPFGFVLVRVRVRVLFKENCEFPLLIPSTGRTTALRFVQQHQIGF